MWLWVIAFFSLAWLLILVSKGSIDFEDEDEEELELLEEWVLLEEEEFE